MRGTERFLVENRGDLAVYLLHAIQLGDALPKPVLIGMLCVALHTPLQPDDLDPDVAAPTLLIQHNLLDHQPDDLLAAG